MSEEEVANGVDRHPEEPNARTVLKWMILLVLLLTGVVVTSHLALPVMRREGLDPGSVVMVRALSGSLLAILVILVYVLGWAELLQGWRHRSRGGNIFFTVALIFINVIGAALLCVFDPYLRTDLRKPRSGAR